MNDTKMNFMFLNSNNSSLASQCQMPQNLHNGAVFSAFNRSLELFILLFSFIPHPNTPNTPNSPKIPNPGLTHLLNIAHLPWAVRTECPTVQCQVGLWHHCPKHRPCGLQNMPRLTCLKSFDYLFGLDIGFHSIRSKFGLTNIYRHRYILVFLPNPEISIHDE